MSNSRPVTAQIAVEILELLNMPTVTKATIRQWAQRGKVRKYGLDNFGLQKYELRDIMLAAHQMRERVAS